MHYLVDIHHYRQN